MKILPALIALAIASSLASCQSYTAVDAVKDSAVAFRAKSEYDAAKKAGKVSTAQWAAIVQHATDGFTANHPGATAEEIRQFVGSLAPLFESAPAK